MTDPVRVWLVPVDVPPGIAAACWEVLDESERARAAAFLSARDRQRFVIGHGALRILAAGELGTRPDALSWASGLYGKPELAHPWSGLHTSLSHSDDMIAAAASASRPVGVDIQNLVPGLDAVGLAARFFPPDEAGYVAAGQDASARAGRFAHLWVRKEAVVKAAGGRLWPNLAIAVRGRDVVSCAKPAGSYRLADVTAPVGYRTAVALAGTAPFVLATARWPGAVTGPSRQPRSPRAVGPGSAAAPGQARGRTAARHHPDG
jgi:4'-phosphopantetheinyl transferase